jgi:multiple sugar transport system permease protein
MVLPVILVVVLIAGFPLLFNVFLGFTDASAMTGLHHFDWVGLDTFAQVYGDPTFQAALQLTFLWTVASLVLQLSIGLLLALFLHDSPTRVSHLLQPVWLLPWVLPDAAAFYIWRVLYDPNVGQLQQALQQLGAGDILSNSSLAIWALVLAGTWKGFPFFMILFYSALEGVPSDLYDAARVDGASRLQIFRYVEWREVLSVAAVGGILGFIWIFNWVTPVFVLTQGGPGFATTTAAFWIYQETVQSFYYSSAAAGATALIVSVTALLLVIGAIQVRRRRAVAA